MALLPEALSNPLLSIVDVDTVDRDLADVQTTGDYAVASSSDGVVGLEQREGRDGDISTIDLVTYPDDVAAFAAFEDGDVDWAIVPSARHDQAVEAYGSDAFSPFQAELYFGLNLGGGELDNPYLRRAIQLAIDREAIVDTVYPNLADVLPTVVPAGVAGHDPDRCPGCAHDPDAAEELVELAFPDGEVPVVHVDFDESDAQQAMAEMIAEDLDAVGIPTELRALPLDEYKQFVVSGDQELFSFGWIGAYASPDAYLAPLFGSAANDNLTGFRSATVDGLLARARRGQDPDRNQRRWAQAEAEILGSAVVVPIAQFRTQAVVADRVSALTHAVDGTVDWSDVTASG
jgi:ABC-type transport system substrate-binding protein